MFLNVRDLDIGNQFTILGNGGVDDFLIYPHDAAGNLTINGNLGIGGGSSPTASSSTTPPPHCQSTTAFTINSDQARRTSAAWAMPFSAPAATSNGSTSAEGLGPDTFYAIPQPTTTLSIHAGSPRSSPGDMLNLDLARARTTSSRTRARIRQCHQHEPSAYFLDGHRTGSIRRRRHNYFSGRQHARQRQRFAAAGDSRCQRRSKYGRSRRDSLRHLRSWVAHHSAVVAIADHHRPSDPGRRPRSPASRARL